VAGVTIPFPALDVFARVSDKALLMDTAESLGIGVPRHHVAHSPDDRSHIAQRAMSFPVVLKPGRSVAGEGGTRTRVSVSYAKNPVELTQRLAAYPPAAYPILLQQRVVGPGIGVFLLLWDGVIQASFCHRRIREKPPSGGVSVYRESAEAPAFLVEKTKTLLDRFGWQGVAMVEYKLDQATGIPYLMEINGRFWGSLQLAVDAGVDFPNLLVALAHGEHPAPVARYRLGVRSRWWWGDVDQLIARLTRSSTALALPPGSPGRIQALLDFLRIWRPGDRNEILRWNDPAPLVRETLDWFRRQ
jgi:predicted ATP-grasp superfamily ATP-dependent carboligase